MAFQQSSQQRSLERWLGQEVMQTNDANPPADLAWECPTCGPQPPVALANHRWVRRRCRCEREKLARQAATEKRARPEQACLEPGASMTPPSSGSVTRVSHVLSWKKEPQGPPPAELIWRCPTCGLREPVRLPSGRWVRRSCSCERQAREEREQEAALQAWRREQLQRTFGGWLGSQWADPQVIAAMATKTFASYEMLRQPEAFAAARAFAQEPRGNLLFWGEYGLGKTHLEAAICHYAREVGWPDANGQLRPSASIFVSAPHLFAVYHELRKAYDQTPYIRFLNALTGSPLLVIDDIDKKTPREWDWDTYWMIFEARYTARRPTVLSTNKREELARYIGEASLSRLSRELISVEMHGDDYRREESSR